jgi:hypothetical protein
MKYIIWTVLATLTFYDSHSQVLIPFKVDTLWGYKDNLGLVQIEPQFQYAAKFVGDVAIVAKKGKLGAINNFNQQVLNFQYEFLYPLDSSEFLFGSRAKYFGEYLMGVITKHGKVKIPVEYNYISKSNNSYTVTKKRDSIISKSAAGDVRSVKSRYGLFDIDGHILIPCEYDYLNWVNDSLIVLSAGGAGRTQALFSKKGKQLTSFDYMVFGDFIEGVAKARIGNKYGFIYPTGKVAIPIVFEYCENFNNGYALIKQGDKWGAINKKGKIIIKPDKEYEAVKHELKATFGKSR